MCHVVDGMYIEKMYEANGWIVPNSFQFGLIVWLTPLRVVFTYFNGFFQSTGFPWAAAQQP